MDRYWKRLRARWARRVDRFLSLVRTVYVKDKAREGLFKELDERIYGA